MARSTLEKGSAFIALIYSHANHSHETVGCKSEVALVHLESRGIQEPPCVAHVHLIRHPMASFLISFFWHKSAMASFGNVIVARPLCWDDRGKAIPSKAASHRPSGGTYFRPGCDDVVCESIICHHDTPTQGFPWPRGISRIIVHSGFEAIKGVR